MSCNSFICHTFVQPLALHASAMALPSVSERWVSFLISKTKGTIGRYRISIDSPFANTILQEISRKFVFFSAFRLYDTRTLEIGKLRNNCKAKVECVGVESVMESPKFGILLRDWRTGNCISLCRRHHRIRRCYRLLPPATLGFLMGRSCCCMTAFESRIVVCRLSTGVRECDIEPTYTSVCVVCLFLCSSVSNSLFCVYISKKW